jgi:hypothetical protein
MSVSVSGDTVIVGAWGSAFIFARNSGGANAWGQVATVVVGAIAPLTSSEDSGPSVRRSHD